jgi:hypothetical protein
LSSIDGADLLERDAEITIVAIVDLGVGLSKRSLRFLGFSIISQAGNFYN